MQPTRRLQQPCGRAQSAGLDVAEVRHHLYAYFLQVRQMQQDLAVAWQDVVAGGQNTAAVRKWAVAGPHERAEAGLKASKTQVILAVSCDSWQDFSLDRSLRRAPSAWLDIRSILQSLGITCGSKRSGRWSVALG